jgi:hypothetical protein
MLGSITSALYLARISPSVQGISITIVVHGRSKRIMKRLSQNAKTEHLEESIKT